MSVADDFFTVPQAAEYLGMTGGRVRQLLLGGELPGEKAGEQENAPWLIPKKAVYTLAKQVQTLGRPRTSATH